MTFQPAAIKRKLLGKKPEFRILVMGLSNSANLGDAVICACAKGLIQRNAPSLKGCTLRVASADLTDAGAYTAVKYADLVVFAGGGIIHYQYQQLHKPIAKIIAICEKHGIPAVFNSIGVEDYDAGDPGCAALAQALTSPIVLQVTTRDDVETLQNGYLAGSRLVPRRVADPALWAGDIYGITAAESGTTGLGVIRWKAFPDNGIDLSEQQLLKLWQEVIGLLEEKNEQWMLFTNGWPTDEEFAMKLLASLGREGEKDTLLAPRPETGKELVETISRFKGIVACRLHANIIAASLGIASVGLVWNRKLAFFGEITRTPERFIEAEHFSAQTIVSALEKALREGAPARLIRKYRKTAETSLRGAMRTAYKRFRRDTARRFEGTKLVVYGGGKYYLNEGTNRTFLKRVAYYVDHRPSKAGGTYQDRRILDPGQLAKEKKGGVFILVTNDVDYAEAAARLRELGFIERRDFTHAHKYDNYRFCPCPVFKYNPYDDFEKLLTEPRD